MDAALKTVAYLRVSTRSQDLANQKLAILEFSQKRRFPIDQFIESRISSCAGSARTGELTLRVSVDAALRAGIFKASGSIDPMGVWDERER